MLVVSPAVDGLGGYSGGKVKLYVHVRAQMNEKRCYVLVRRGSLFAVEVSDSVRF